MRFDSVLTTMNRPGNPGDQPSSVLILLPIEGEEDALRTVNPSDCGLVAGVWTSPRASSIRSGVESGRRKDLGPLAEAHLRDRALREVRVRLEKLRGSLDGFHSIRVNEKWRLVFQWDGSRGEATGVYLDDHGYR